MRFQIMSSLSDEELLMLLRKKNEKAFTAIYERYHKLLYVVAYKYLKEEELAKDAVQQVFFKLWESHAVLNISINLKNYLFTMLKNYVLNEIRNNLTAMEKNYELSQSVMKYEDEIITRLEDNEIRQQLYRAIHKLPEQKRIVCLYKLKENLTNQDIAEKMNISIPTVKTHYSQAIKMLRKYFNKLPLFFFCFLILLTD